MTVKANRDFDKETDLRKPKETEASLANRTGSRVFLQTLIVKIGSESGEKEVRAILAVGSQRSYQPKRIEIIVPALFGGAQTAEQKHACFDVR